MSPLLEGIVSAYAEHGAEGVKSDEEFRELCEQHRDDTSFDRTISDVSEVAGLLERTLAQQTQQNQVAFALKTFYGYRAQPDRQMICHTLTQKRYAKNWSEAQSEYYEGAIEKLQQWQDYFLSFTNHNPLAGEVLMVNNEHKRLIKLGLGKSFNTPHTVEENLLAKMLDYRLRNAALEGYYYPNHRNHDGAVEERIQREAQASFAFVQLLQDTMFQKWPNFCKLEFDAARQDESRMLIFIMVAARHEFIRREAVDNRMHDWHDVIMSHDVVELIPATTHRTAQEMLDLIRKRVVEPVKAARRQLFESVPI